MTSERILWLLFAACTGLYGHHLGRDGAPELVAYREARSAEIRADAAEWADMETEWDRACQRMFDAAQSELERDELLKYNTSFER